MSVSRSAPRWALDHLRSHLNDGDQILNVLRISRNLVLANTRLGTVLLRNSILQGSRHYTLAYPANLRTATDDSATTTATESADADVSGDWTTGSNEVTQTADTTPTSDIYREGPYTLYRQETSGKPRYFFSKGTPAAGTASPLPPGYIVGRNSRTGLPFLKVDPDYVPETEPATRRDHTKRYTGDVHKVIDIEGIGKVLAAKLNGVGITDTDELGRCDPAELAAAVDLGQTTIELWQAMGELMKVSGIGKQYAEVLAYAGLHGIDDLKNRSAAGIARAVGKYVASQSHKPIGTELTPKRVETWQATARKMRKSATTVLHPQAPEPVAVTPAPAPQAAHVVEAIPAQAATPTPSHDATPTVRIKGPSSKPSAGLDLSGLDPTRGDISVQWDTAPQMVAERSHKARPTEAPVAVSGKGNEVKVDLRIEARPVEVPSHQATVAATVNGTTGAAPTAAPVTPRAAPSLLSMPEGAEVNLAGRRPTRPTAPTPAAAATHLPSATAKATAPPTVADTPQKAVDGSEIQVVRQKGGVVKASDAFARTSGRA